MATEVNVLLKARNEIAAAVTQAKASLKGLGDDVARNSAQLQQLGFGMAAIGAAGVAGFGLAVAASSKYEDTMAKIRGLTGASARDTDMLRESIADMTKEIPKTPQELGSAAYFILSSGIKDAASATEVLRVSAKASAAGLGETEVVANALTSVLNAYKLGAEEAGRVTDILVTAVKEGKAEADEFAVVLGQVVPIAAEMGIGFEEVAANLAILTRTGANAHTAALQLRATMRQLIRPSEQAKDAMAAVGLSAEGLRATIKEKGLLAALQLMKDRTGDNVEVLGDMTGETLALLDVLSSVGSQSEAYAQVLDEMNNSAGETDRAFGEMSETLSFQLGLLRAQFEQLLIQVGDSLVPMFLDLASGAQMFLDVLNLLPDSVRDLGVRFAFVTAAVLAVTGALVLLVTQIALAKAAMATMGAEATILSTILSRLPLMIGGIGLALTALTFAPLLISQIKEAFSDPKLTSSPEQMADAVKQLNREMVSVGDETKQIDKLNARFTRLGASIQAIDFGVVQRGMFGIGGPQELEFDATTDSIKDQIAELGRLTRARDQLGPLGRDWGAVVGDVFGVNALLGFDRAAHAAQEEAAAFQASVQATIARLQELGQTDFQIAMQLEMAGFDDMEELEKTLPEVAKFIRETNDAYLALLPTTVEQAQEQRAFQHEMRNLDVQAKQSTASFETMAAGIAQLGPVLTSGGEEGRVMGASLIELAKSSGVTEDQAKALAAQLRAMGLGDLASEFEKQLTGPNARASLAMNKTQKSAKELEGTLAAMRLMTIQVEIQIEKERLKQNIEDLLPDIGAMEVPIKAVQLEVPKLEIAEVVVPDLEEFVQAVVTAQDRIRELGPLVQEIGPKANETFDEWRSRVLELAAAYRDFAGNQAALLTAMRQAGISGAEEISKALAAEGPEVLAQWMKMLKENPAEAMKTLAQIAPHLMREATRRAGDAVAQANTQEWQRVQEQNVRELERVRESNERELRRVAESNARELERVAEANRRAMEGATDPFEEWKQRLIENAEHYRNWRANLETIMGGLAAAGVGPVDAIMAVVTERGPEFAANFAKWFQQNPEEAIGVLKETAPAIMSETMASMNEVVSQNGPLFQQILYDSIQAKLDALPKEMEIKFNADAQNFYATHALVQEAIRLGFNPNQINSLIDIVIQARSAPGGFDLMFLSKIASMPGVSAAQAQSLVDLLNTLGIKYGQQAGSWKIPGMGNDDSVLSLLTPGEMVLPKNLAEEVRQLSPDMERIPEMLRMALVSGRSGGVRRFAAGGMVGAGAIYGAGTMPSGPAAAADGGMEGLADCIAQAVEKAITRAGLTVEMDGKEVARLIERRSGRKSDLFSRSGP